MLNMQLQPSARLLEAVAVLNMQLQSSARLLEAAAVLNRCFPLENLTIAVITLLDSCAYNRKNSAMT